MKPLFRIPDPYREEMLTASRMVLLDLRVLFLSVISIAAAVLGIYFGFENYTKGYLLAAWADFIMAAVSLALLLNLTVSRQLFISAQLYSLSFGIFMIVLAFSGGAEGLAVIWIVLYPSTVFFAAGLRSGIYYSVIVGTAVFTILFMSDFYRTGFGSSFLIRLTHVYIVYIISFVIGLFYEIVRTADKKLIQREIIDKENAWNELTKALASADESNQQKKSVITDISHRALTPLNGIIGCMQLLEKEQNEDLRLAYFKAIEKSSAELAAMVQSVIRNYSETRDSGEKKTDCVSVSSLLEEIAEKLKSRFEEKRKILEIQKDGDFSFLASRSAMLQILTLLMEQVLHWTSGERIFVFYRSFQDAMDGSNVSLLHSIQIIGENEKHMSFGNLIGRLRKFVVGDLYRPEALYNQGPSMSLVRNLAASEGYFVRFRIDSYDNLILELSNQDLRKNPHRS